MRIHLIKEKTIRQFALKYPASKVSFEDWLGKIKHADWETPEDVFSTFQSADLLGNGSNRVVFDIGGNNFRMICKYAFGETTIHLFVCWIGIHAEYDKICKGGKQYTVNIY